LAYGGGEGEEGAVTSDAAADTEVEGVLDRDAVFTSQDNSSERHIGLMGVEASSDTERENSVIVPQGTSRDTGTTRDIADLGIVASELGAEIKSDDDDHGTITDDYEADSEEPVTAFDNRRYSEVTGGMSEMSLMDTIICVGFGYALVYA